MIWQTAVPDPNFEHVGCAFDCLAYAREKFGGAQWNAEELDAAWNGAKQIGILDADFNITDWQALANYLNLSLTFAGKFNLTDALPAGNLFIITAWHNDRTGFTHFVVGQSKPVEWDPIEGGSVTVAEGYPISNRVFQVA